MSNKANYFKKNVTLTILIKFVATLVIYSVSIVLLAFLGVVVCAMFKWQRDDILYRILLFISDNINSIMIILFVAGFIVIFFYYWAKTLNYLKTIVNAAENIFVNEKDIIVLPSDLKELENQLNQVKFNVAESKRLTKEAEQRKNDLVVYLAHDLKTPLTSVIGYLTLLHDEGKISQELREKYLSIALDKSQRLEDLINEFFEITRFNLSGIVLEQSRVNLSRMLEQLVFEFNPMFREKGLQCVLNVEPELNIKCDIDKMQRVFDNLLRNAVSYSFEESVININVTQKSNNIKISFSNSGNNIPAEKLNRIFEQFYRLDNARTSKNGGAGIGLAIAKEIVELHNGTIVASSENELITFELTIPIL